MTRIRIPAPDIEADVTAEQVEAYLLRPGSGWTERNDPTGYFRVFERGADSARFPAKESAKDYAYWLGGCVDDIARAEGRLPSAVLADITGPACGVAGVGCRGEEDRAAQLSRVRCHLKMAAARYRSDLAKQEARRAAWEASRVYVETSDDTTGEDTAEPHGAQKLVPLCHNCGDPLADESTDDECHVPHGATD